MTSVSSHSWVTRYFFQKGVDAKISHYVLHFENPDDVEEMFEKFYTLIRTFSDEIGGYSRTPGVIEKDRFLIQGPKGFAIIEIAPAYTEEEFNELNTGKAEPFDLSVWESMFSTELPKEDTNERTNTQGQEKE